jgi:hypothetical protein
LNPRRCIAAALAALAIGAGAAIWGGDLGVGSEPTTPPARAVRLIAATAVPGDCASVEAAHANATVQMSGSGYCKMHPSSTDVTVTGTWAGDIECHGCDGWVFTGMRVTNGSLRMIGGRGWRITASNFDGGNRGKDEVVGVGMGDPTDQPRDWSIDHNMVTGPGIGTGVNSNRIHAVYIIGGNGIPMNGVVADNVISGGGTGAALKIGGTGLYGSSPWSPDAADDVAARGNLVVNSAGADPTAILVATNSDDITLDQNTIVSPTLDISLSGPYSGTGLRVTSNSASAPRFLQAKLWRVPSAGLWAPWFGIYYWSVALPTQPCALVGVCQGNTAR